ncbi:MAG: N-formylglutamate amidohydrolase [Sphingomonadales bacterium]|nr:N-formylglutamate amidohydrolase [Sphingomonadales bacterium]
MQAKVSHGGNNHNPQNEVVEILNPGGAADILLVCDHASAHIPAAYADLGLPAAERQRHIAWDIGAAELTRTLSVRLDAAAILARASRLVIDVNRDLAADNLIPTVSDGTVIPGNASLTPEERRHRIASYYQPYHAAVDARVRTMVGHGRVPLIIGVHSFTPVMNGVHRPWVVGLLWNRDHRLAHAFLAAFRRRGLMAGDNEPYSGRSLFYTMERHGAAHGLPQTTLEIRQDEIGDPVGVARWTRIVAEVITEIANRPELQERRHY